MTEDGYPEKGDVCTLNSGGPLMSIVEIDPVSWAVKCSWVCHLDSYQEAWFPVACVRIQHAK